jgi:hypothetical protein
LGDFRTVVRSPAWSDDLIVSPQYFPLNSGDLLTTVGSQNTRICLEHNARDA